MIAFIIFIIFFFVIIRKIPDKISKFFVYSYVFIWSGAIVLSLLGLYGLKIPHNNTILLITTHLFSFILGFVYVKIPKNGDNIMRNSASNQYFINSISSFVSNKLFLILFLISFIYVVEIFATFLTQIAVMQSLGDVRSEFYEGDLYGPLYGYIEAYFLSPFSFLLMFLFAFLCFKKRGLLCLSIGIYLFIYSSLSGGRFGYVQIIIAIVLFGLCLDSQIKKQGFIKKYQRAFAFTSVGVLFYLLLVFTTAARMGDVGINKDVYNNNIESANKQLFAYYIGPIIAFDYTVNSSLVSEIGGYKVGTLSLSPLEDLFYLLVSRVGIDYVRPIGKYTNVVQKNYISIGDDENWNALYTWCNYFYCDMGLVGIIIFPFIWGGIMRKTIKYYYKTYNLFSGALLLYMYIALILSVTRYPAVSVSFLIVVTLFIILGKRVARNNKQIGCEVKMNC